MARKPTQSSAVVTQKPEVYKAVLTSEFKNRKIEKEAYLCRDTFSSRTECLQAIVCMESCGHHQIWEPLREYCYPRLVCFFWQNVAKTDNEIYFSYGDRKVSINEKLIAQASGYFFQKPNNCPREDPSPITSIQNLQDVANIIGDGTLAKKNAIYKGTLEENLWFLEAIIKNVIFTNAHISQRIGEFLHALLDAHHGRWISVPALFMAGFEKQVKALKNEKSSATVLHFPFLITAILEFIRFPIAHNEPKDTAPRMYTLDIWHASWMKLHSSRLRTQMKQDVVPPANAVIVKPANTVQSDDIDQSDVAAIGLDGDDDDDRDDVASFDDQPDAQHVVPTHRRLASLERKFDLVERAQLAMRLDVSRMQLEQLAMRQDISQLQQNQIQSHQLSCYTSQLLEMLCLRQVPNPDFLAAMRLSREQPFGGQPFQHVPRGYDGAGPSGSHSAPAADDGDDADDDDDMDRD